MNAARELLNALGDEVGRLANEAEMAERYAEEIRAGRQSEPLLQSGLNKREAASWAVGVPHANRDARDRISDLYEHFKARLDEK